MNAAVWPSLVFNQSTIQLVNISNKQKSVKKYKRKFNRIYEIKTTLFKPYI
jgi:hypothetical protein